MQHPAAFLAVLRVVGCLGCALGRGVRCWMEGQRRLDLVRGRTDLGHAVAWRNVPLLAMHQR